MKAHPSRKANVAQPRGRAAALTIAAVTAATLLAALGLRLATRGEAFSHRVVVGAIGCGEGCDQRVARALADDLVSLGFDAVAPGGLDAPEAVRKFARDHGARFGVSLRVAVEQSTQLDDAARRVGAKVALYVMDAESDDAPTPSHELRGIEEANDERTALAILAARLGRGLSPAIGSALLASEPVRALQRDASGLEQQAAALALKRREKAVRAREEAMREYRLHCEGNDEALASVEGGRCVSDGCAEDYLVGLMPDGSAAVVHDSTDAAVFPLAQDSTARGILTSEKLWLVPREGARTLLAEAANFYSRPALSRDGSTLAFIEQRLGRSRLYALEIESRRRVLIHSTTPPRHLSQPRLTADGTRVLYYELQAQRGRAALMIADASRGESARELLPHALDARFVELPLAPGEPRRLLVAALVPALAPAHAGPDDADAAAQTSDAAAEDDLQLLDPQTGEPIETEGPRPALVLIDPDSGERVASEAALAHHVRAIGDGYGDSLLLSWQDQRCGFARYTPGRAIEWVATDLCPKHIAAGGGGVFAHALVGTKAAFRQLVRIDVESGKLELLTKGTQDVQNPRPAPAAAGLAYERVMPRKYGELQHVAVCFDER